MGISRNRHLPATLLASFVKRLARLSLSAPPAAIIMIIPFTYNILKRHLALMTMIHRTDFEDSSSGMSLHASLPPLLPSLRSQHANPILIRPLPPDGAQPSPNTSSLELAVGTHFTQDALPFLCFDPSQDLHRSFQEAELCYGRLLRPHLWNGMHYVTLIACKDSPHTLVG